MSKKIKLYVLRKTEGGNNTDVVVASSFYRANNAMKRIVSLLVNSMEDKENWNIPAEPDSKALTWRTKNQVNGRTISYSIRLRIVENEKCCGTCFHSNWDCEKCLLGNREIANKFVCNSYLPLGTRGLGFMNELRAESGIKTYGTNIINERPMTINDIPKHTKSVNEC